MCIRDRSAHRAAGGGRVRRRGADAGHLVNNLPGTVVTALGAALLAFVDHRLLVLANVVVVVAAGLVALRLRRTPDPDVSDAQVTRVT